MANQPRRTRVNLRNKCGLVDVETDIMEQASILPLVFIVEDVVVFLVVKCLGVSIVGIIVLHDINISGLNGVIVLNDGD